MIIAVDFDGTLCENTFPDIGEPKREVISWVKSRAQQGDELILWTCRENEYLKAAVEWCKKYEITFVSINENSPKIQARGFAFRKIFADRYLDDRSLTLEDIQE